MKTYMEKERECQIAFEKNGPFWHVYTDGTLMEDIFCSAEDFNLGITLLAVCTVVHCKVELITFELMNNHVHLIMRGELTDCLKLFDAFKGRLKRAYTKAGRVIAWNRFVPAAVPVETLQALRNEIIYANRNAYVANNNYTPFSYPWGGGWAYFSPVIYKLPIKSVKEVGVNKVRKLTHYRHVSDLAALKFVSDVPFIPSFCRVDIGEQMFHDARSYFHSLTRNVEAFSQIASRLKDSVFLTDDEMFVVAARCASEMFSAKLNTLTPDQKIQLARKLHFDYNASNQSLRRVLKLEISILNEMFPSPTY